MELCSIVAGDDNSEFQRSNIPYIIRYLIAYTEHVIRPKLCAHQADEIGAEKTAYFT